MFQFKLDIFAKKRREFCYAGMWSLYVDLATGNAKACYGQPINQNIFSDATKPIIFRPVGHFCRMPFCFNGHAYLALGVIPELATPTYADIRNRKCINGKQWFTEEMYDVFSSRLYNTNPKLSLAHKIWNTITKPFIYAINFWCYHLRKN